MPPTIEDFVNNRNKIQTPGLPSIDQFAKSYKAVPKKVGFFGSIYNKITKSPISEEKRALAKDFGMDFTNSLYQTYLQTPTKIKEDIIAGAKDIQNGDGIKGRLKSGGRVAADAANAIFAPISSAIGAVLNASGGQKITDEAGQIIADKSGITDLPAFQKFAMEHPNAGEDFNRILTLFMSKGEKGTIDPVRLSKESTLFAKKVVGLARDLPVTSVGGENVIPVKTPLPVKSIGGENKIPVKMKLPVKSVTSETQIPTFNAELDTNLPKIDFGTKTKSSLPTIQVGESIKLTKTSDGKYTYEPVIEPTTRNPKFGKLVPADTQPIPTISDFVAKQSPSFVPPQTTAPRLPQFKIQETKPPQTTTETITGNKPSGLAKSIEAKAIEAKLTEGFKDVAGYDSSTIKEQAQLSDRLIKSGIDNARSVIRGETPLPDRLRGSSLIVAMEEHLKNNPNPQVAYELANSPLVSAVSRAGSELGLMQNRVQDSFTAKIQEIRKAREATVKKKTGRTPERAKKDVVEGIKREIKKSVPTKQSWSDFIESVKCGY